jgi:ABC-2 type transport system permease protein
MDEGEVAPASHPAPLIATPIEVPPSSPEPDPVPATDLVPSVGSMPDTTPMAAVVPGFEAVADWSGPGPAPIFLTVSLNVNDFLRVDQEAAAIQHYLDLAKTLGIHPLEISFTGHVLAALEAGAPQVLDRVGQEGHSILLHYRLLRYRKLLTTERDLFATDPATMQLQTDAPGPVVQLQQVFGVTPRDGGGVLGDLLRHHWVPGSQTAELARRSVLAERRQLLNILPGLVFPLLLAAVYSRQFSRALAMPGFPEVDSFLDFILPACVVQAVSFGATAAGTELALDIENGFFDRLVASPVARFPILVGRLAGASLVAAIKAAVLVAVFLAFGAEVKGGPAAVLVIMAMAALLVLAIGGVGQVLAIRTGSQEAVAATFPLVFVGIFMSSAFFPTALMSGWFRVVAENNPITWVIDPTRRLVIAGWSTGDAIQAMVVPAAVALVTVSLAIRALHRKLGRS